MGDWEARFAGGIVGVLLLLAAMPVSAQAPAAPNSRPAQLLTMCDDVANASPANAKAIRATDDALVALALANLQLGNIYRAFVAACPAFLHHAASNSPEMQNFRDRTMDMTLTNGAVADKATALRNLLKTGPVATAARHSGKTGDAAFCASTITLQSADLLKTADALVKRTQVDCGQGGK